MTHPRYRLSALWILAFLATGGWLFRSAIRHGLGLPTWEELRLRSVRRQLQDPGQLSRDRLMVALITGQSNAGNYGPPPVAGATQPAGIFNFSKGRLYAAIDPLLGSDGLGSSPWVPLGTLLIQRGCYSGVVFALQVRGGTAAGEWLPGAPMQVSVSETIAGLRRAGLPPTHILWMQGETDAGHTRPEEYANAFHAFLAAVRTAGIEAPVYVALETHTAALERDGQLRRAQESLVNAGNRVFPGPDVDTLDNSLRRDGTHFNRAGLQRLAELWLEKLCSAS